MSIKTTFLIIFATLIGLLVSLVMLTSLIAQNQRASVASEYRRYESFKLADELRQSSEKVSKKPHAWQSVVPSGESWRCKSLTRCFA